ncbi:acetyl-CoA carboxylase, biotin carboxyl carrier protein [Rhodoferax koreense]|uniref:Biotin carboxyl carrier protein of acetyl-CoA carboxylase n=1 Tax=Rhodoferax koreensis TaxID=1842727 RepID=A0A1P8JUL6_9BURK|nr:acetyl-CoA carboxylase biotin carboxyl carrier protein [Rhodoferax koreense]APW37428.1 acetyl-CoA carboxylase, biotin carboxyl carrier protein [Rhodoferax koreense]
MNLTEIKALIDTMAASDLSEMELTQGDTQLRLVRRKATPASAAQAACSAPAVRPAMPSTPRAARQAEASASPASAEITAPLYGVVHWKPSPDAAPFVATGQSIKAGQVVCVVEAMKVFNEVRAEADATVLALLVEPGAEVEAGQPLLRLG